MREAIGATELSNITHGIDVSDQMVKVISTQLTKTSTVCPGKYIVIIDGSTSDVGTSMERGIQITGEYYVDNLPIPSIHSQLISAIDLTNPVGAIRMTGVMEFYSAVPGIRAVDIAAKTVGITLVEVRMGYTAGGKGVVLLMGDMGTVKTTVTVATAETEFLLSTTVTVHLSEKILQTLLQYVTHS